MPEGAKRTPRERRRTPKVEKKETSEREGNDEEGGVLWGDNDEGKQKVKKEIQSRSGTN